jgi:predicted nucleic acid-binding protein
LRAALDTNILAYAEGANGPARKDAALALIDRLPASESPCVRGRTYSQ